MFVLTQALLYLLVVQNYRPVTHELIQYLLQSALLFCTLSDCSWIYNICLIKSNSIGCYIEKISV